MWCQPTTTLFRDDEQNRFIDANKTKQNKTRPVEKEQNVFRHFSSTSTDSHMCAIIKCVLCLCVCDSVFEFSFQSVRRSTGALTSSAIFAIYWAKKRKKYLNIETFARYRRIVITLFHLILFHFFSPSFRAYTSFFCHAHHSHLCTYRSKFAILSSCVSKMYSNCVDSLVLIVVSHTYVCAHECLCFSVRLRFLFKFLAWKMWMVH